MTAKATDKGEMDRDGAMSFERPAAVHLSYPVTSLSISSNGRDAVLAAKKGLYIIDLDNPYLPPRVIHHMTNWEVSDVQWNPHRSREHWIATTSNQKALVWNLAAKGADAGSKYIEYILGSHQRAVSDINWSPFHPELLATCSYDTYIHLWDLRKPPDKPSTSFCAWTAGATQVKFNRISETMLASSHDTDIRIWDTRKGSTPVTLITAHMTKIYGIDWSRNNEQEIITCGQDRMVKFWDISEPRTCQASIMTGAPVWRARFTPFGNGVVTMPQRKDTNLLLWDCDNLVNPVHSFEGHTDVPKEFVWRVRGQQSGEQDDRAFQLVTWSKDQYLRLWPISREITKAVGHESRPLLGSTKDMDSLSVNAAATDSLSSSMESVFSPAEISRTSTPDLRRPDVASQLLDWEIRHVLRSYPGVVFEKISLENRTCTMTLQSALEDSPSTTYRAPSTFLRIDVYFPSDYPNSAPPTFNVQKTGMVSMAQRRYLATELSSIAGKLAKNNEACLLKCVGFLMSGKSNLASKRQASHERLGLDSPGSLMSEPRYPSLTYKGPRSRVPSIEKLDVYGNTEVLSTVPASQANFGFDASSSDSDMMSMVGGRNNSQEKRLMKDVIVGKDVSNVPFPRLCGASFSSGGQLVCFFSPLPHPSATKFTAYTLVTRNQQPVLQSQHFTAQPRTFPHYESYRAFIFTRVPRGVNASNAARRGPPQRADIAALNAKYNDNDAGLVKPIPTQATAGKFSYWLDSDESGEENMSSSLLWNLKAFDEKPRSHLTAAAEVSSRSAWPVPNSAHFTPQWAGTPEQPRPITPQINTSQAVMYAGSLDSPRDALPSRIRSTTPILRTNTMPPSLSSSPLGMDIKPSSPKHLHLMNIARTPSPDFRVREDGSPRARKLRHRRTTSADAGSFSGSDFSGDVASSFGARPSPTRFLRSTPPPSQLIKQETTPANVASSAHSEAKSLTEQTGYITTVMVKDVSQLLPINRQLAERYSLCGDDPIATCVRNGLEAHAMGRADLVRIWSLATLILTERKPSITVSTTSKPTTVPSIRSRRRRKTDDRGLEERVTMSHNGVLRIKTDPTMTSDEVAGWNMNPAIAKLANSYPQLQKQHHPFGRALVQDLFRHLEVQRDVQMIALLSCVFSEQFAILTNSRERPRSATRMQTARPKLLRQPSNPYFTRQFFGGSSNTGAHGFSSMMPDAISVPLIAAFSMMGVTVSKMETVNAEDTVGMHITSLPKHARKPGTSSDSGAPASAWLRGLTTSQTSSGTVDNGVMGYPPTRFDTDGAPSYGQSFGLRHPGRSASSGSFAGHLPGGATPDSADGSVDTRNRHDRREKSFDVSSDSPAPYDAISGGSGTPTYAQAVATGLASPKARMFQGSGTFSDGDLSMASTFASPEANRGMLSQGDRSPALDSNRSRDSATDPANRQSTAGVGWSLTAPYSSIAPSVPVSRWSNHSMPPTPALGNQKSPSNLTPNKTHPVLMLRLSGDMETNDGAWYGGNNQRSTTVMGTVTPKVGLLDPSDEDIHTRYKVQYAELLYTWGLTEQRAEVLRMLYQRRPRKLEEWKKFQEPIIGADPLERTDFHVVCPECGNHLVTSTPATEAVYLASMNGTQPPTPRSFCRKCARGRYGVNCAICRLPCKGVASFCLACGHGGHADHMNDWFSEAAECPTGCGCVCRESSAC
ncbi:uncharacterized protein EV422DRAFT_524852 [Fimicolochytrium jonesii]|uniref:uncharacterized protein n=1 Tax=Fimicolochytrium jonesii TaxID=1396493 RepID=UPI0022FE8E32|nr:uncharacterized protein EV422DRAFT_524852 [Fimicolochytrium jonesii]KAI8822647.1 hypothetical protein EV422DRAFT_524852 [Fimicolochytrium jonesii]